jgi:hypothetical protein
LAAGEAGAMGFVLPFGVVLAVPLSDAPPFDPRSEEFIVVGELVPVERVGLAVVVVVLELLEVLVVVFEEELLVVEAGAEESAG